MSKASGANTMSEDERQINKYRGVVNRFKGILVKMIKDKGTSVANRVNGVNDYSILPKIRHMLLHWGYELVDDDII